MENRLLNQFNNVIIQQWPSQEITESYDPLNHKELFEIAYHSCNSVGSRTILLQLSQDEKTGGNKAIIYSKNKTFTSIEGLDDSLIIKLYFNEQGMGDKLRNTIQPLIKARKEKFGPKEKKIKIL